MSNDSEETPRSGGPSEAAPYPVCTDNIDASAYPSLPPEEQDRYDAIVRRMQDDTLRNRCLQMLLAGQPPPTSDKAQKTIRLHYYNRTLPEQLQNVDILLKRQDHEGGPGKNRQVDKQVLDSSVRAFFQFFQVYDINELPGEILVNIFRIACWSSRHPQKQVHDRVSLSHVCRRWRSLMLSDAVMWSTISLDGSKPFDRVFAYLDRARNAPLHIFIEDNPKKLMSPERMGLLLDRLFDKLPRIRSLIVSMQKVEPATVVLEKLKQFAEAGSSINMQRFEIHRMGKPYLWMGGDRFEPLFHRVPIALFGGVPSPGLTHVIINGVNIDWSSCHFSNLTCLDLRRMPLAYSPSFPRFLEMLRSCPLLEKLVLDGVGPANFPSPHPPPVLLDRLKLLVMGDFSAYYTHNIIQCLSAPNLIDLALLNIIGEDYNEFFRAITGAFPNLQAMSCYNVGVSENVEIQKVMVRWLLSCPRLKFMRASECSEFFLGLFLADPHIVGQIPLTKGLEDSRNVVCPNLDILQFNQMPPGLIASWVRGRKALGVPVKKIYVSQEYLHTHKVGVDPIRLEAPMMIAAETGNLPAPEERQIHIDNGFTSCLEGEAD